MTESLINLKKQAGDIWQSIIGDQKKIQYILDDYYWGFKRKNNNQRNRTLDENQQVWEKALTNQDFKEWFSKINDLVGVLMSFPDVEVNEQTISDIENVYKNSYELNIKESTAHEFAFFIFRKSLIDYRMPIIQCSNWKKYSKKYTSLIMNADPNRIKNVKN